MAKRVIVTIKAGDSYGFAPVAGWHLGIAYRQPIVQNAGIFRDLPIAYVGREKDTGVGIVYVELPLINNSGQPLEYEVMVEEATYE